MKRSMTTLAVLAGLLAAPVSATNIVEAAKVDGSFTKLLAANDTAGTTAVLEGKGPFTVFAPNDAAFAKVPAAKLAMLMKPENRTMLKVALVNHVVTGILSMDQIEQGLAKADAVSVMAANNMPLVFKREAGAITVNGAHIVKGPMKADNGLVYVVDTVLMPAMPLQPHY